MDNYKDVVEEYKKINSNIANRIITLSITVIGAIFVICERYGRDKLYLLALLGFVLTITVNFANNICKSKHYELALDGKIKDIDFRNSCWGIIAEILYWIFIILFLVSIIIFAIALVISVKMLKITPIPANII